MRNGLSVDVLVNIFLLLAGVYIYLALVRQISARQSEGGETAARTFDWPDAIVALILGALFVLSALHPAAGNSEIVLTTRDLIVNGLISASIFVIVAGFLTVRGMNVGALAGFSRIGFMRVLLTACILLFAAYPLLTLADVLTQRFLGGAPSRQAIVELFTNSQTLSQRALIIVLATAIAPLVEEFVFRFFFYGVLKRYFGRVIGLLANAALFSAVHAHLPSAAPLFVLGSCFTLAYEWSGSILVPMTMHALFNSLTLLLLAFPEFLPQ